MATIQTQVHPTGRQRHPLASEQFQHRLELWTIIHALGSNTKKHDLRRPKCSDPTMGASDCAICLTPSGKQHPGALPHRLPSSHRCLHQMVARETGTASLSAPGSLVFKSKSSTHLETISSEMASTNSGLPNPLSFAVLQNGVHQTRSGVGPTLQP